ncbi:MAG: Pseudouridine-5'-phosphatase [Icmadophila ericetorum]|nr:Pseudouridine-5'-phosphatase [Icmadophila ericetorum]
MDGLLLDTEDIYTECTNIMLKKFGKPTLPWKIKAQLQGRPGPEAAKIFHAWAHLPIDPADYTIHLAKLQAQKFPACRPLPGVPQLLSHLADPRTRMHIALATSSHAINYKIKTAHQQDLFQVFPPSQVVLGDDPRIPKGKGKPAPDIYLLALETINAAIRARNAKINGVGAFEREIAPEECLVFEDSVPGVEAGRRAGMRVVWVPHKMLLKEYLGREKEVLAGLTGAQKDDDEEKIMKENCANGRVKGKPGQIDDGWGEFRNSLERFDYAKYGIPSIENRI